MAGYQRPCSIDGCDRLIGRDGPHQCAYSADPERYMALCRSCHKRFDVARREEVSA